MASNTYSHLFIISKTWIFFLIILEHNLVNPASTVFGEIGQSVTLHSHVNLTSNYYTYVSWYLQRPSGRVVHLAYFGAYTNTYDRYSGVLPKTSEPAYLNISNAKIADSGRYFAVVGTADKLIPGSSTLLSIRDPKRLPVMRVFLSRTGTVLCELKGGGPHWSDPWWEKDDAEEGPKLLKPKAEAFLDENGDFIRSTVMSLGDGVSGWKCVCQHGSGVIIRKWAMQDRTDQCRWLLYVSPPAALLLLVTVTASGLWVWRKGRQSPECRE